MNCEEFDIKMTQGLSAEFLMSSAGYQTLVPFSYWPKRVRNIVLKKGQVPKTGIEYVVGFVILFPNFLIILLLI